MRGSVFEGDAMKITVKIEPNSKLTEKAKKLTKLSTPGDSGERQKYAEQLEEVLNELLEYKNQFYERAFGGAFGNVKVALLAQSIPIEVTEDKEIEEAILEIFERKINLYKRDIG